MEKPENVGEVGSTAAMTFTWGLHLHYLCFRASGLACTCPAYYFMEIQ